MQFESNSYSNNNQKYKSVSIKQIYNSLLHCKIYSNLTLIMSSVWVFKSSVNTFAWGSHHIVNLREKKF